MLWRSAFESLTSVGMGAEECVIARGRTSLNLRIRWVYHPWMGVKGWGKKMNNINMDEY
jgi:hypothetical protein